MKLWNILGKLEYGKCEKYVIEKYQENWKYGNLKNRKWENIKKIKSIGIWKIGNGKILRKLEVWKVWKIGKNDNRNKSGSILGGGGM